MFLLLLALLCASASARAQPADWTGRHLGVQLRALGGPAYLFASQDVAGETDDAHGFGLGFSLALGSMIGEQLALNMDLVLIRSADAEHGVLDDTTFSAIHLGAGVTYWVMPANVYLAASLGLARSSVAGNPVRIGVELPTQDATDMGAGLHLAAGKQWWVSRRVGLGASVSLLGSVANNPVGGEDSPRWLFGTAAAFTVTLH